MVFPALAGYMLVLFSPIGAGYPMVGIILGSIIIVAALVLVVFVQGSRD